MSPDAAEMWSVLQAEQGRTRLWNWGWAGFYGAVVVGQGVIAATTDNPGARANAQVNIVASGVGALSLLVFPPPLTFGLGPIDEMPTDTAEARTAHAAAIRVLFLREARWEGFYRSVWNRVLGLAVNAGVSAYLYWGLHLGARALLTLGAGSVIFEAQVHTSPHAVLDLSRTLRLPEEKERLQLQPLLFGPEGAGLALVGHFG